MVSKTLERILDIIESLVKQGMTCKAKREDIKKQVMIQAGADQRTIRKYLSTMRQLDLVDTSGGLTWAWNVEEIEKYREIDELGGKE